LKRSSFFPREGHAIKYDIKMERKWMRTKIIYVLAMLCFLVATAAAGMLGWDPAGGIMAEDMLPSQQI
jgi:hypothetical protein